MHVHKDHSTAASQHPTFRKAARVVCLLAVIFLLLNAIWFAWRAVKYGAYSDGMAESPFSSILVPRYVDSGDGYNYSVKYPDYLSFIGNLSVSIASSEEELYSDALIIWPNVDGSYEFGLILYDEAEWQIYVDASGRALDPQYDDIVAQHQENVDFLFAQAYTLWELG